jgi:hypothetical protein
VARRAGDRVGHAQKVLGLRDPPVLGERCPERGGAAVAVEHTQQVVGADLVSDQGTCDLPHVGPVRNDLVQDVRTGWRAVVANASTADGAAVIQWPTTGGANQDWRLVPV